MTMKMIESNLLVDADRMSESTLVGLPDWELAYLRVAMLRKLEETLEQSIDLKDDARSTRRGVGFQDHSYAQVGTRSNTGETR
jgi:hypothetical protein